jgi:hypothetical protein
MIPGTEESYGSIRLLLNEPAWIKGWTTPSEGRAFRLAEIGMFDGNGGTARKHSSVMNGLRLEVIRCYGDIVPYINTPPHPSTRLVHSKDDTKKWFNKPSLTCVEGAPFPVRAPPSSSPFDPHRDLLGGPPLRVSLECLDEPAFLFTKYLSGLFLRLLFSLTHRSYHDSSFPLLSLLLGAYLWSIIWLAESCESPMLTCLRQHT